MGTMYLLGYKIKNTKDKIDFYNLALYNDECIPLHKEKKLIFFENLKDTEKVFKGSDLPKHFSGHLPKKVHMVCDLIAVEKLLKKSSIDRQAIIINSCNLVDDLLTFLGYEIPLKHRRPLHRLLNRLTFYRTFGGFLKQQKIERNQLLYAVEWMKTTLIQNAIVVQHQKNRPSN